MSNPKRKIGETEEEFELRLCAYREKRRAYYASHKEQVNASAKRYRESHKEQIKAWKKNYRASHKEQTKAYCKAYNASHREQRNARSRAYNAAHREQRNARSKAYKETHNEQLKAYYKAYYESHKEQRRASRKAYNEAHKEEIKAYQKEYRDDHMPTPTPPNKKKFEIGQKYLARRESGSRCVVSLEYVAKGRFKTPEGKTVYADIRKVNRLGLAECAIARDFEAIFSYDIDK